jgi:RecA-family ATPase
VFIAEPLVTLHTAQENDNSKMNQIVHLLSGIADSCDCSIDICHHTRKLLAGTEEYSTDDGRGASAIRDAVRGSRVLNSLSREEARNAGIEEQERAFYFRVDRGKANYLPAAAKATWRKFENVELLNGDQVGVVVAWEFPGHGADTPKKAAANEKAELVFLQLLDKFAARHVNVSANVGPTYAPAKFAEEREAKIAKVSKIALKEAMDRLLDHNRVHVKPDPGKRSRGYLVPGPEDLL